MSGLYSISSRQWYSATFWCACAIFVKFMGKDSNRDHKSRRKDYKSQRDRCSSDTPRGTNKKKEDAWKQERKLRKVRKMWLEWKRLKMRAGKKGNFSRPRQIQNPSAFHPREKTRRERLRARAILAFHTDGERKWATETSLLSPLIHGLFLLPLSTKGYRADLKKEKKKANTFFLFCSFASACSSVASKFLWSTAFSVYQFLIYLLQH